MSVVNTEPTDAPAGSNISVLQRVQAHFIFGFGFKYRSYITARQFSNHAQVMQASKECNLRDYAAVLRAGGSHTEALAAAHAGILPGYAAVRDVATHEEAVEAAKMEAANKLSYLGYRTARRFSNHAQVMQAANKGILRVYTNARENGASHARAMAMPARSIDVRGPRT